MSAGDVIIIRRVDYADCAQSAQQNELAINLKMILQSFYPRTILSARGGSLKSRARLQQENRIKKALLVGRAAFLAASPVLAATHHRAMNDDARRGYELCTAESKSRDRRAPFWGRI
jgi:hypothetical protein